MATLQFHNVDPSRWEDFEILFDGRGGPKSCWCMVWRSGARSAKGADRKSAMTDIVARGATVGLLGYLDGAPVAWCSIAPRATYRDLGGLAPADGAEQVWSLACLFIRREHRGQGFASQMIAAAVRQAKDHGATAVEAYPVDPESPSYRFMGFVPAFAAAGFHAVGTAGTRRHVMRRDLRSMQDGS